MKMVTDPNYQLPANYNYANYAFREAEGVHGYNT